MKPTARFINVHRSRHGRVSYYFRRNKGAWVRLPDDYGSDAFWAAYHAAFAGEPIKPILAAPRPPRKMHGKPRVYFVQCGELVKIGTTKNPKRRVSALQIGNPSSLNLIFHIPGDVTVEKSLHERFSAYRKSGEWFRVTGELRAFIDEHLSKRRIFMPSKWDSYEIRLG